MRKLDMVTGQYDKEIGKEEMMHFLYPYLQNADLVIQEAEKLYKWLRDEN